MRQPSDPRRLIPGYRKDATATDRQRRRFLHTGSAQWRAIRKVQLQRFPLCEDCQADGIVTAANEVDHNTGDTSRNLVGVELSSLCKPCHSRRTARRERGLPTVIGCDADGWPLDPSHPWNAAEPKRKPWLFPWDESAKKSPAG